MSGGVLRDSLHEIQADLERLQHELDPVHPAHSVELARIRRRLLHLADMEVRDA